MKLRSRIDLNIGDKYLSDWKEPLAIRELIANALDERDDGNIQIKCITHETYSIINEGSEIEPNHFQIKEGIKNLKKGKIGKFGIGLKDDIAVLTTRGIIVKIFTSKYTFKPEYLRKCDIIEDENLFINIYENKREWIGTEFILEKCSERIIEEAKLDFLKYRESSNVLESTKYGQVILEEKKCDRGTIYFNGMKIAQEGTFIFYKRLLFRSN